MGWGEIHAAVLMGDIPTAVIAELEARNTERHYTNEVLRVFAQLDLHDDLLWQVGDNGPRFAVICNDVFYWACADAETIERTDLPALYQAAADATEADEPYFAGLLFVARKRGMRPQQPWGRTYNRQGSCYDTDNLTAAMRAWFDACGDEPVGRG